MADKDADTHYDPGIEEDDDVIAQASPGVPVPGPVQGPPEPTPRELRTFDADQRTQRLNTRLDESIEHSRKLQDQETEELAPKYSELNDIMNRPKPEMGELKKPPPQPDLRMQLNDQSQAFMGLATLIAAVGAGRTRNAGTTGLMAMAGIFNGIREGNEDRIKHDLDVWKQSVKVIKEENDEMVKEYKAKLEDRHLDLETKMEEMKIIAQKYKDQLMMEALYRKNLIEVDKLLGARDKIAQQAETQAKNAEKTQLEIENKRADLAKKKREEEGTLTWENAQAMVERMYEGYKPTAADMGGWRNQRANAAILQEAIRDFVKRNNMTMAEFQQHVMDVQASQTGVKRTYTQQANIGNPMEEIKLLIPQAEQAINEYWGKTGNTGIAALRWNQAANKFSEESNDPGLRNIAVRLNEVMAVYGQALARNGVSTDASRAEARKILQTADSPQTAHSGFIAMYEGILAAQKAPERTRQQIRESVRGRIPSKNAVEPEIPDRPFNVPPGSQYNPARKQWRSPDGKKLYQSDGTPIL